jgi:hypothetical protein
MPEAQRRRPEDHAILRSFRSHLRARPAVVFEALHARLRPIQDPGFLYKADPAAFFIIAQSRWWYRGEYRVVPDETGSNVEYVIVNVAQRARSLSRVPARALLASAPTEFERLIGRVRREVE